MPIKKIPVRLSRRQKATLITLLLTIAAWTVFLYFIPAKDIVSAIGVENSYWVMLLIGALAGVSSFTSTSAYGALVTFALGGSHVWLLAVCAGVGMTIGDSVFYYLGHKGKRALPDKVARYTTRFEDWLASKPGYILPLLVYLYAGFTPFPGDILNIFLGLSRFAYYRVVVPIIAGNITLMAMIGWFAKMT